MRVIRVTGYDDAVGLVEAGWPTHVVTAMVSALPSYGGSTHLHVEMDDVMRPAPGVIVPTGEHVRQVLEFTQAVSVDDRLLIHCYHGLNRSPALAIGVLLQDGRPPAEAYQAVVKLRPGIVPNRLLVMLIDRQFDLDGELVRTVMNARPTLHASRGS